MKQKGPAARPGISALQGGEEVNFRCDPRRARGRSPGKALRISSLAQIKCELHR